MQQLPLIQTKADGEVTRRQLPMLQARAAVQPATFDADKRTVEVVVSTGARVLRYAWDGPWYEELKIDDKAVRMGRLKNGASVLNNHDSYTGLEKIIGVVDDAWITGGEIRARIRFSGRAEIAPFVKDIAEGIIRHISVGYAIHKLELVEDNDDEAPVYLATDWEPHEVSFCTVPADDGAGVRAKTSETDKLFEVEILTRGKTPQLPEGVTDMKPEAPKPEARTEPAAPVVATPAPADTTDKAAEAAAAERNRAADIRTAVRTAKLPEGFADELVAQGITVDAARAKIIERWAAEGSPAQKPAQTADVLVGPTERTKVSAGIENAVLNRLNPGKHKLEAGKGYRGLPLIELARASLEAAGIRTAGMSRMDLAGAALGMRAGFHTISDFPEILANVVMKELLPAYEATPRTFVGLARESSAQDFKPMTRVRIGDAPDLQKVNEAGEFTRGSIKEAAATYKVNTYGRIVAITRQVLINDDLGAFDTVPQAFGAAAADLQSDVFWNLVTSNPSFDGNNFFYAGGGNLAAAPAAIDVNSIATAAKYFRNVKNLAGRPMSLVMTDLVVGPEKEKEARQYLAGNFYPQVQGNANVQEWLSLRLRVEPRITDASWYLFAVTPRANWSEYAYLDGESAPFVETRTGFDVDGMEVKARLDFGAGLIDRRPAYKVPA